MLFLARHGFPYVGRMSGAFDFMGRRAGRMGGMGPCEVKSRRGECLDTIRQWLTVQL